MIEYTDSDLITELYYRNVKESFSVDEMITNFNFKIDVIFDSLISKLDKLQKEIKHEQIRDLFINGKDYSHLMDADGFIFWSEGDYFMRDIRLGNRPYLGRAWL